MRWGGLGLGRRVVVLRVERWSCGQAPQRGAPSSPITLPAKACAVCHLACDHLWVIGVRAATAGAGRGVQRDGGLRSPLLRALGLSGRLDVRRQRQGGFVK